MKWDRQDRQTTRPNRRLSFVFAMLLLCGCATPDRSAWQTVRVQVTSCPQAQCTLENDKSKWVINRLPGTVRVRTSAKPLLVVCQSDEQLNAQVAAKSGRKPLTASDSSGQVPGAVLGAFSGLAVVGAALGPTTLLTAVAAGLVATIGGALAGKGVVRSRQLDSAPYTYPSVVQVALNCGPAAVADSYGFSARGLTDEELRAYGPAISGGALVTAVGEGGPAALAGMRRGDLILSVSEIEILDPLALRDALAVAERQESAPLVLMRDGARLELRLEVRE